ncbi:MAG: hypothetical protein Q8O67_31480 [Deltaproteobacteria bacterium]|nr:hypothetical protein [Deltaproteobacteria bacterium]
MTALVPSSQVMVAMLAPTARAMEHDDPSSSSALVPSSQVMTTESERISRAAVQLAPSTPSATTAVVPSSQVMTEIFSAA